MYEGDPAKTDSAFTMYYMAVNVGSTLSQIFTPLFAGVVRLGLGLRSLLRSGWCSASSTTSS